MTFHPGHRPGEGICSCKFSPKNLRSAQAAEACAALGLSLPMNMDVQQRGSNNRSTCCWISWSCASPRAAMGAEPGLAPGGRFAVLCYRGPFCHLTVRAGVGGLRAVLVVGATGYSAEGFILGSWSVYSGEPGLLPCSSKGVITPAAARPRV